MKNELLVSFFLEELRKEYQQLANMKAKIDDEEGADFNYFDCYDEWQESHVKLVHKLNCPYLHNVLYNESCKPHYGFGRRGELAKLFEKKEKFDLGRNLGPEQATLNFDEDSPGFDMNHWDIKLSDIREAINHLEHNLNDLGDDDPGKHWDVDEILRVDPSALIRFPHQQKSQLVGMRPILQRCENHLSDYTDLLNQLELGSVAESDRNDDLEKLTDEINLILAKGEVYEKH